VPWKVVERLADMANCGKTRRPRGLVA